MNMINNFVGRIMRGLGVVGLVTALAMMMLPTHSAAAKTVGGGKVSGGGALNIHIGNVYNGANIEGAKVTVYSTEGWEAAVGVSDETGYFDAQVAIGTYIITATASGYEDAKAEVAVQLGEVTKTALQMTPVTGPPPPPSDTKAGLSLGTVMLHAAEENTSGTASGIAGADVRIYSEVDDQIVTKGLTDDTGDYSTDLGKGAYTMIITANSYEQYKASFEVVAGDVVRVDALLKSSTGPLPVPTPMSDVPPGSAVLTVYALNNPAGIAGVADANVTMYSEESGVVMAQGLTDAKGKFSATVPEGMYTVSIVAAGYEDFKAQAKAANNEETTIIAQMILTSGPAPMPTPASTGPADDNFSMLNIFVKGDTSSDPGLADADVQIYSATSGELIINGLSDSDGKFSAKLADGAYVVTISAAGYNAFNALVSMPNADDNGLVAQLTTAAPAPVPAPAPIPIPCPSSGC